MNPSNGNGRADRFNPPVNVPQEIALKWADGRPCQSPYSGDQMRYVLTDERQWYTDLSLAERIRALNVASGELLSVTKKELLRGNRRSIEWEIRRAEAALPAPAPVVQPPPAATQAAPQVQANPTVAAPVAPLPVIDPLARFIDKGRMAIDAVLAIEAYAHQKGMPPFAFTADNVEKIWVHLSMQNGGR